jgi:hypothetical protein
MMPARKALLAVWREQRADGFAWGVRDCLTFCGDVALAMTGTDPIADLRGRYTTAVGARRVMASEGWADMGDVAASFLDEIPVAWARSGDWAQIDNGDGTDTLGVVAGATIAARTETRGIGQVPLTGARRAFRVAIRNRDRC